MVGWQNDNEKDLEVIQVGSFKPQQETDIKYKSLTLVYICMYTYVI